MKKLSTIALIFIFSVSFAYTQEAVPKAPTPKKEKDTTSLSLPKRDRIFSVYIAIGNNNRGTGFGIGLKYKEFGFQVTSVGRSETTPECLDYAPPHYDYEVLTYQKSRVSFDFLYMPRITKYVSVYAGLGFAYKPYDEVARSNATGWYYKLEGGSTETGVSYSAGAYFDYEWFGVGAGYHSNIGPYITLGVNL